MAKTTIGISTMKKGEVIFVDSMNILSNIRSIDCLSRFNDDKHLLLDKRLRIRARIKGYYHYQRIFKRLRFDDVKIFVKTVGPFHSVRESLPQKNVEVIQTKNDVGVVLMNFQRMTGWNFSLTLNRLLIMSLTYKENVPIRSYECLCQS